MEEKNKFDASDNLDDFDKMLFDYYDKQNDDIPFSTQLTIENALKNRRSEKSNYFSLLKKVAVFIACIGIVTATTVYAKDIVSFISNIFTNSNPGIDKAVENGYVQNVDMDFIVCNDVGVKVDYLLMDDHNLDISFVYKYFGEDSVDNITFNNLTIKDLENNILCLLPQNDSTSTNTFLKTSITTSSKPIFIDNFTQKESILVTTTNSLNTAVIRIEITQIALTHSGITEYINGNWHLSINNNNKTVLNTFPEYSCTSSPYIENLKTELTETSLLIDLQLNTSFNETTLYSHNAITLKDKDNNVYIPAQMRSQKNANKITLLYPISGSTSNSYVVRILPLSNSSTETTFSGTKHSASFSAAKVSTGKLSTTIIIAISNEQKRFLLLIFFIILSSLFFSKSFPYFINKRPSLNCKLEPIDQRTYKFFHLCTLKV